MSRGRRVDDHELPGSFADHAVERLEYRDLLGAWRPQVFLQEGPAGVVEVLPLGLKYMLAIALAFHAGIDAAHLEPGHVRLDRHREVRRGVGRREVHRMTPGGELHGDRRGDRGLSDPALAEHHHQPVTVGLDLVDQPGERRQRERRRPLLEWRGGSDGRRRTKQGAAGHRPRPSSGAAAQRVSWGAPPTIPAPGRSPRAHARSTPRPGDRRSPPQA